MREAKHQAHRDAGADDDGWVGQHRQDQRHQQQQLIGPAGLRSAGMHAEIVGRPADVIPVLEQLDQAGATAVVDHMMLLSPKRDDGEFLALLRLLERGNVYVKLSGLYRLHNGTPSQIEKISWMVRMLLYEHADRLLWGSDWPHPDFDGPAPLVRTLMEVLKRRVFYLNHGSHTYADTMRFIRLSRLAFGMAPCRTWAAGCVANSAHLLIPASTPPNNAPNISALPCSTCYVHIRCA